MSKKILKTVIGIILSPLLIGVSFAFYEQFGKIEIFLTKGQQYFLGGIITYCLIQLFLIKPVFLYVLGHETVHALAVWLCLGKVTSFKISSSGGSVSASKSNLFISLSPYFIPIYAILLMITYYVMNNIFSWKLLTPLYFMFLFGMMLAFHIVMTVDTLKTRQPDLIKVGYLTSLVLIYVVNLTIVSGVFELLFKGFSFLYFLNNSYFISIDIYKLIFKQLFL